MPTKIEQQEINEVAWRACDTFRGALDPAQYKDYILTMLFLKYMSDLWTDHREALIEKYEGDMERVERALRRERFVMPPESDFYYLHQRREAPNIGELINIALQNIEEANKAKLENVFRNVDFNSEPFLGQTADRNRRLKNLLEDFADKRLNLRPSRIGNVDVIGNTYEYLIGRFASDAGKKGGEFYTPKEVAELLARLLDPKPGVTICDPACGSGSLLIRIAQQVKGGNFSLFGQESNGGTWALCRMNMFLHGMDAARIEWGDTLNNPKLVEESEDPRTRNVTRTLKKFDIVVANPPFSLDKWGQEEAAGDVFKRYFRGMPPKSRADYAFISHMVETAVETGGKVGVIVPHGVLFRGGAEGKIRQRLLDDNLLAGVIGLPVNLFFGTGIPAAILLFERGRESKDVMFIDASGEFADEKRQNRLRPQDIEKIMATYRTGEDVEQYAHCATIDEIKGNEYNLNIPRYVNTFAAEKEIDVVAVQRRIEELEAKLANTRAEMNSYLAKLEISAGSADPHLGHHGHV
jgi:type I restriction enzyme M protein